VKPTIDELEKEMEERGRDAAEILPNGEIRIHVLDKVDDRPQDSEPLTQEERERVEFWMRNNPGTAKSCTLPRIWARLSVLEAENGRQKIALTKIVTIAEAPHPDNERRWRIADIARAAVVVSPTAGSQEEKK
jgi:hypothetical protein